MEKASSEQHSPKRSAGRIARFAGRLASKPEQATKVDSYTWELASRAAKSAGRRGEQATPIRTQLDGEPIAETKTQNGYTRALQGILFAGQQKFGLVAEISPDKQGAQAFYLTAIGEGQNSAVTLRSLDLKKLQTEVRPEGYVQPWQEMKIGRGNDNDIVAIDDPILSRNHASLTVDAQKVEVADTGSRNGTSVFTAAQAYGNTDPSLAAVWEEMNANPALWSGEYQGATVVKAQ